MNCIFQKSPKTTTTGKRCCPKLQFGNMFKIDDSLEDIIAYADAAIGFVSRIAKSATSINKATCPFQLKHLQLSYL